MSSLRARTKIWALPIAPKVQGEGNEDTEYKQWGLIYHCPVPCAAAYTNVTRL